MKKGIFLILAASLGLGACTDDFADYGRRDAGRPDGPAATADGPVLPPDGGAPLDGPRPDGPAADGPMPGALAACLESPTELPRPPSGSLPCELIPPSF